MFEGLKDMGKLLKQANEMKAKMKDLQKELKETQITEESSDKKVKVLVNGEIEVLSISIDPGFGTDFKKLEKVLLNVLNEALKTAKEQAAKKVSALTGGMNIPGLMG